MKIDLRKNGVGKLATHKFLAVPVDRNGRKSGEAIRGTVTFPSALERDNSWRMGAVLSDDSARLEGHVRNALPAGPAEWEIGIGTRCGAVEMMFARQGL